MTEQGRVGVKGTDQRPRPCAWCGRPVGTPAGTGRPRQYCRRSCRQRAYEARRRADDLGLGEAELVVARNELDALRDQYFVVTSAIDDAVRGIDRIVDVAEAKELLRWIASAAEPLP